MCSLAGVTDILSPTVDKNKFMQHNKSGSGTAEFQVTWLLKAHVIGKKCTSTLWHRHSPLYKLIWPLHVRIRGNWVESVSTLLKNGAIVRFLGDTGTKMAPSLLLGSQAFQRGFIRRNLPRDDEPRLKSLEEKPWIPAGGPWVPAGGPLVRAGGVNCSFYAAMEHWSSFSVLGNLLRLVRKEHSCSPWSFFAPSRED